LTVVVPDAQPPLAPLALPVPVTEVPFCVTLPVAEPPRLLLTVSAPAAVANATPIEIATKNPRIWCLPILITLSKRRAFVHAGRCRRCALLPGAITL